MLIHSARFSNWTCPIFIDARLLCFFITYLNNDQSLLGSRKISTHDLHSKQIFGLRWRFYWRYKYLIDYKKNQRTTIQYKFTAWAGCAPPCLLYNAATECFNSNRIISRHKIPTLLPRGDTVTSTISQVNKAPPTKTTSFASKQLGRVGCG